MSPPNREYRLQVGDEIQLKFYLNPELDQDVIVRPDGKISLQLLDDVAAVGLTPMELDSLVTEEYRTELRDPKITVIVKRLAAKVYVGGEVRQPRFVALSGSLTILQAVLEAGGFTDTAEPSSAILLRRLNHDKGIAAKIDLKKVISAEAEDLALTPSDIIFIPKSTIAEVNLFVEQYITKLIPVPFSLPLN
jgi:protein involved in polysaccharide export with SLBB domain